VYGTTDGHTSKIAAALADVLRAGRASVDVFDAAGRENPSPDSYDATIVVASVHVGAFQRAVRRWVWEHRVGLAANPSAFVAVCLAVLDHDPATDRNIAAIVERFLGRTGWTPSLRKVVAGALLYTHYGWLKRQIMRRIARRAGGDTDITRDYEYTDWQDLEAFAREFRRLVTKPGPAPSAKMS
jgi:menaquinone-dependent protoporphyrinogen oxidase